MLRKINFYPIYRVLSEAIFSHVIYGVGKLEANKKGRFNVLEKGLSHQRQKLKQKKRTLKRPKILQIGDHAINDVATTAKRGKPVKTG